MLNMAVVIGNLTKPVEIRSLPSGTSVASFDLQVLRTDQSTRHRADYIVRGASAGTSMGGG